MSLRDLRSLLFVPATSPHLLEKATQRGADAIIVDLEDAVPLDRKDEARRMAIDAVRQLKQQGARVVLRVNAPPAMLSADLAAAPLEAIDAVMLPKAESAEQVRDLDAQLSRLAPQAMHVRIVPLIESARGLLACERIADASSRVCALGFGAEDYAAEMSVVPELDTLAWPAQYVTTCARAFDLACWGLPGSVAEVSDMDRFAALVRRARGIGFTGSVCIHPRQVPVVNEGFGPTAAELAWAQRVIDADAIARRQGKGAVLLDGRMIDRPVVARAARWLARRGGV